MKAYEFAGEVTADGQLKIPGAALSQLAGHQQAVRVIVLVQEPPEAEAEDAWKTLATNQFLAGYSPEDAIYDAL
jgi:uncharacterized membrane protein